MSHLFYFILFVGLIAHSTSFAQKRWDGGGGNNLWNTAANWTGNTVPLSTDNVVLDNSLLLGSYTVVLPSTAVTVKTITITPANTRTIVLTLPVTNTAVPGLTVNGPGHALVINNGGTFRNSSGSTSGNTVRITDTIRINNGGRYVHNSASAHTANVQSLSLAAGTEQGILELDIPTASSTISFSGRTFGKLVLRSTAAGGTCNYTAAGTSRVNIRDDLDLGPGVTFNLNCSDTIFVGGDFIQEAGTFNLGNSTRSVVLGVKGSLTQNTGGIVTESGTGIQTLLINGTEIQLFTMKGVIQNQVAVVKDGVGLVLLKSPVSLPYKLTLRNGKITTTQGLITLTAPCTISADTLSENTFINGPLKKLGLSNQSFLFPVGKSNTLRWVQLQNATGDFTVEYFRDDPHVLSGTNGSGIHHFSKVEYWDVTTSAGATSKIKLSFVMPGSGTVTNVSSLRVARLINGTWENAGNTGIGGTPGSDGWVSSVSASGFSANSKSFALASASGQENPLPISSLHIKAEQGENLIRFSWSTITDAKVTKLHLQHSADGAHFSTLQSLEYKKAADFFNYLPPKISGYYRMVAFIDQDIECISNTLFIRQSGNEEVVLAGSNIVRDEITFYNGRRQALIIRLFDASGRMLKVYSGKSAAAETIKVNVSALPAGCYFAMVTGESGFYRTFRFIRL